MWSDAQLRRFETIDAVLIWVEELTAARLDESLQLMLQSRILLRQTPEIVHERPIDIRELYGD